MGRGGHAKPRSRRAFPPQNRSLCRRWPRGSSEPSSVRPIAPCRSCSRSAELGTTVQPLHQQLQTQLNPLAKGARFARLPLHASSGFVWLLAPLPCTSSCPRAPPLAQTPPCPPPVALISLHAAPCSHLPAQLSLRPPPARLPLHARPCRQQLPALLTPCSALLAPSAPVCPLPHCTSSQLETDPQPRIPARPNPSPAAPPQTPLSWDAAGTGPDPDSAENPSGKAAETLP